MTDLKKLKQKHKDVPGFANLDEKAADFADWLIDRVKEAEDQQLKTPNIYTEDHLLFFGAMLDADPQTCDLLNGKAEIQDVADAIQWVMQIDDFAGLNDETDAELETGRWGLHTFAILCSELQQLDWMTEAKLVAIMDKFNYVMKCEAFLYGKNKEPLLCAEPPPDSWEGIFDGDSEKLKEAGVYDLVYKVEK